jgi:hypothetical protein
VDYLQLLNTGNEKLDTSATDETAKVSQLAVQLKQLARNSGAAILALSDITKEAQKDVLAGKEFTLNMLRGSNRVAHAADTVLALYSEAGKGDGGKADDDPWEKLAKTTCYPIPPSCQIIRQHPARQSLRYRRRNC